MNAQLLSSLRTLKKASHQLGLSTSKVRNTGLKLIKEMLLNNSLEILEANQEDLKKIKTDDPVRDRLLLDEKRIQEIGKDMETVIGLEDPLDRLLEEYDAPSGIDLKKVSVPLGCIGIIYESRPNVTVDVTTLCLKSGNAVLLRGSSNAWETNQVLVRLIQEALEKSELPPESVQLLSPDHELAEEMMKAHEYLDVIIPRGGKNLIERVREESTVPILETGASVVHTYVDESANFDMALNIVHNEKIRRPSVCNAIDTLLVNKKIAHTFLPLLAKKMKDSKTILHTDQEAFEALQGEYPSACLKADAEQHYDHEFLALEMNVRLVKDLDEAIEHIQKHSLKHSESIVTENKKNADRFQREVDAACVFVNTSTAFSDGAQFGLGAEIGVSTQKLHARGPMGLKELTSYKWLISSDGLIRSSSSNS